MRKDIRDLLVRASMILLGSGIVGFSVNALSPQGIRFVRKTPTVPQEGIGELELADAYSHFKSGDAVFVDARHPTFYKQQHIPGSVNVYFKNAEMNPALQSMDKTAVFIVYCKSRSCDQAHRLARAMYTLGFRHVYVYVGGMTEWLAENYPTESTP